MPYLFSEESNGRREVRHFLQQAKDLDEAGVYNQARSDMLSAAAWLNRTNTGLSLTWLQVNQAWLVLWGEREHIKLSPVLSEVCDVLLGLVAEDEPICPESEG